MVSCHLSIYLLLYIRLVVSALQLAGSMFLVRCSSVGHSNKENKS